MDEVRPEVAGIELATRERKTVEDLEEREREADPTGSGHGGGETTVISPKISHSEV
jgi:hypothetical protein